MSREHADHRAHRLLIPAVAVAVILAGCSSGSTKATTGGTSTSPAASGGTSTSSAAPTTTTTPSSAASTGSTGSSSAQESLAARMAGGIGAVTSVHLAGQITSSSGGGSGVITADEKLDNGKATALRLSESIAGQNIGFVIIGTKSWVKLPTASKAKPWAVVSPTSSNAEIRTIAAGLARTTSQTSLTEYISFAKAASAITKVGSETIDGVATTRYRMTVDVAKLPSTTNSKALSALGITSIPTSLWLDSHGRAIRISEVLAYQGQHITTTIDLTRYNASVSIMPPPASQISG